MRDANARFAIGNDGKISNQVTSINLIFIHLNISWTFTTQYSTHFFSLEMIFFSYFLEHFLSIQSILRQWTVYITLHCHSFGIAYFRMLSLTLLILALFLFFFWWTTTTTALLHCIRYGTHISASLTISIRHPKRTGFIYSFCLRSFFCLLLIFVAAFSFANFCIWKGFLYVFFFVSSHQHLMMFVFFFCCYIDISGLL